MNNEKQRDPHHHTDPAEGKYCTNEGERVCTIGDYYLVCENNHWKAVHEYCESDSEKQLREPHQTYPEGQYCGVEGETICSRGHTYECEDNHWHGLDEKCPDPDRT